MRLLLLLLLLLLFLGEPLFLGDATFCSKPRTRPLMRRLVTDRYRLSALRVSVRGCSVPVCYWNSKDPNNITSSRKRRKGASTGKPAATHGSRDSSCEKKNEVNKNTVQNSSHAHTAAPITTTSHQHTAAAHREKSSQSKNASRQHAPW